MFVLLLCACVLDPLNASQESGLLGEHISLPVTNTVSSHTDQGAAPIRAGVAGAGAVASDSGGNNQGPSNGGAVGQEEEEEEEVNEFEQLQSDRESAFVRALMEPLEAHDPPVLPPEYINYIASDIAERFNQTVSSLPFSSFMPIFYDLCSTTALF